MTPLRGERVETEIDVSDVLLLHGRGIFSVHQAPHYKNDVAHSQRRVWQLAHTAGHVINRHRR